MSLIEDFKTPCVIMNKIKTSDGQGGTKTTWEPGAEIMAAIVNDTSMTARIAEQEGVTSTYTITTGKEVVLNFPDVIKRLSDGEVFRVTSNQKDKISPSVSTLNIAQVTAEKWSLTDE